MFETIEVLFTIGFWVVAVFLFLGGLVLCIGNLIGGNGLEKIMAGLAVILGIVTFFWMYDWSESVAWCLLATGLELGFVAGMFSDNGKTTQAPEKEDGFLVTLADDIIKRKNLEETIANGIRKSRE